MQLAQNSLTQRCPEEDSHHAFDAGSARARSRKVLSHTYEVTYSGVIGPEARLYLYQQIFLAAKGRMTLEIGHHAVWWGDPNDHSYGGQNKPWSALLLARSAFGLVRWKNTRNR